MTDKKILKLTLILLASSALAVVVLGAARRCRPSKPGPVADMQLRAVPDNRPLKEKAKASGHASEIQPPRSAPVYADLADLVNHSSAVVIGVPQQNRSVLSTDGRSISLDYTVRLEYVYKGKLQPGDIITVRLPGGRVKFDDGSVAEVMTPWFKKMQNGKTYTLFLQSGTAGAPFINTGEAQGVFEIPTTREDRLVKVHSGIPGNAVRKYHGQNVKNFLSELRRVTGKPLKG